MFTQDRLPPCYPEPQGYDFDGDNSWLLMATAMGFGAREAGYYECPFPEHSVAAFIWHECFIAADAEGVPLPHGYFSSWLHDGRVH